MTVIKSPISLTLSSVYEQILCPLRSKHSIRLDFPLLPFENSGHIGLRAALAHRLVTLVTAQVLVERFNSNCPSLSPRPRAWPYRPIDDDEEDLAFARDLHASILERLEKMELREPSAVFRECIRLAWHICKGTPYELAFCRMFGKHPSKIFPKLYASGGARALDLSSHREAPDSASTGPLAPTPKKKARAA